MTLACPVARCGAANAFEAESCARCGVPLRGYAVLAGHAARLFNEGLAAARSGSPATARDRFTAVVQWCPNDVEARNALALALFQLGDADEAGRQWERVLELRPEDRFAADGLAGLGSVRPRKS